MHPTLEVPLGIIFSTSSYAKQNIEASHPSQMMHTCVNNDRRNCIPTVATANQKTLLRGKEHSGYRNGMKPLKKMVNYGMFCA